MIVSITGPSGVGKGYIKEKLLERYPSLKELVWITTRALRPDEYYLSNRKSVSIEEFRSLQKQGELILVQELFGCLYGLRKSDLYVASEEEIYLTEFHIDNLIKITNLGFQVSAIALIPSDISLLWERLEKSRRSKDFGEIKKRTDSAKDEISKINLYRSLFLAVIEVSKNTGNTDVSQVLQVFEPILASIKEGKL